jgi:hypothetical protein
VNNRIAPLHLRKLFADDAGRGQRFLLEAAGIYLDYSQNRITEDAMSLLVQLAERSGLRERIDAMFRGGHINVSEIHRSTLSPAMLHGVPLSAAFARRNPAMLWFFSAQRRPETLAPGFAQGLLEVNHSGDQQRRSLRLT